MPTIYLDVLLLQSLYVNYFLLRAAAKLTHTPLGWLRCGLAAAGSSLFSLLILLPPLPVLLQLLLKLLAAAAAVVLAFGLHRESFFRQCGCFFLCNFLLAGLILAVDSLTPRGFAAWGNSCCYLNFPCSSWFYSLPPHILCSISAPCSAAGTGTRTTAFRSFSGWAAASWYWTDWQTPATI